MCNYDQPAAFQPILRVLTRRVSWANRFHVYFLRIRSLVTTRKCPVPHSTRKCTANTNPMTRLVNKIEMRCAKMSWIHLMRHTSCKHVMKRRGDKTKSNCKNKNKNNNEIDNTYHHINFHCSHCNHKT